MPRLAVAVSADAPEGFAVKLDGVDLPRAAWGTAVETDPGPHRLEASGHRLVPIAESFELREGETKRMDLRPTRIPTAYLSLAFRSRPAGMAIDIDGKPLDPSVSEKKTELDVGDHVVRVQAPGYVDFVWKKNLQNDVTETVTVDLQRAAEPVNVSGGTPKWLFFTMAGASLIALGGGAYFAITAKSASDEEQQLDPLLRSESQRDTIQTQTTLANALLVGGAVLAVASGVLAFTTQWKSPASPRAARIAPFAARDGVGIAAAGTF